MPTFEIPDGPTTVDLQGSRDEKNPGPATGSIVFNVTNKSAESADGSLSVQVTGSTKKEWFTIDGDQVRTFGPGETQTAKINVSLGTEVPPGDYPFRLRAAAVVARSLGQLHAADELAVRGRALALSGHRPALPILAHGHAQGLPGTDHVARELVALADVVHAGVVALGDLVQRVPAADLVREQEHALL